MHRRLNSEIKLFKCTSFDNVCFVSAWMGRSCLFRQETDAPLKQFSAFVQPRRPRELRGLRNAGVRDYAARNRAAAGGIAQYGGNEEYELCGYRPRVEPALCAHIVYW